jgi:hypothetical protein
MSKHTGRAVHRFAGNPKEKVFADYWRKINDTNGKGTLEYLLAEDNNCPWGEMTDRDAEVAATVIQWLGSPVGQHFLRDVNDAIDKGLA